MNKIFDKGLFVSGLRRAKTFGITATVILAIVSVMIVLMTSFSGAQAKGYDITVTSISFMTSQIHLVLCFCIFAPIMTLSMFSFLNKRSGSDFYHSIPHKRQVIVVSFMLAVMVWTVFMMAVSSAVGMLTAMIAPGIRISFSGALTYLLAVLAGTFMVSAAVLIAMSLTGTLFSNIAVALVIIFLPRAILTLATAMILDQSDALTSLSLPWYMDYNCNVAVGTVFYPFSMIFVGGSADKMSLCSLLSVAYTAVLGLIYAVVGVLLFGRRNSEAAGKFAATKKLNSIARVCIALVFCLPAAMTLFNSNAKDPFVIVIIAILYLPAVIVYFVCELISSHKLSSLVHVIPGLLMLILINAALVLGMRFISDRELEFKPTAEEIKSVQVRVSDLSFNMGLQHNENSRIFADVDGDDTKKIVSDSLLNTINGSYQKFDDTTGVIVKIKTDKTEKIRRVYIRSDPLKTVISKLCKQESLKKMICDMPEYDEKNVVFREMLYNKNYLNADQMRTVYESLKKELSALTVDNWHDAVLGIGDTIANVEFKKEYNGEEVDISMPVSYATPKTYSIYAKYLAATSEKQEIIDTLSSISEEYDPDSDMNGGGKYILLKYCDGNGNSYEYEYSPQDGRNFKTLVGLLKNNKDKNIETTDAYIAVCCRVYVNNIVSDVYIGYFYLPKNGIPGELKAEWTSDAFIEE